MDSDRGGDNGAGLAQQKLKQFKSLRFVDAEGAFLQAGTSVVAIVRNGLLGSSFCDPRQRRVAILLAFRDAGL
jgi:hypothetical protein